MPILSIIIPTYNRVTFLETTVNIFIAQIQKEGFEHEVEIVIGNDASHDETREYLERLEPLYQFIKTFSNPENLGVSGNVEKLVRRANSEFIWLFGEDDIVADSALKKVIESIKTDAPNVILVNAVNMMSLDDRNLHYTLVGENRMKLQNDVFIKEFEKEKDVLAAAQGWLYLTNLISAVIFKKELFLLKLSEAKQYVQSKNVYVFQAVFIIGIAKLGRFKILAERIVLHRKNETHWSKTLHGNFIVSLYDGGEIVRLVKNYMPSEYKNYQKIFAAHTFGIVMKAKKEKINVTRYIIDAIKIYYSCYPYNMRFCIALITPGIIFTMYEKYG